MRTRESRDDLWEIETRLVYKQCVFRAIFHVRHNGLVEMIDDTVLHQIPKSAYRPRRFPALGASDTSDLDGADQATVDGGMRRAPAHDTVVFLDIAELEEQHRTASADNGRQNTLQRYIDALRDDNGRMPLHAAPSGPERIAALRGKYPNFVEIIDFVADEMTLATLLKRGHVRLPPCIIEGEPGVGKTRFLHDLAVALEIHLETLDMASATAGFELAGSSSVWRGGRPGVVVDAVVRCGYANPMILLDELDKVPRQDSSPIDGPLHALLEHVTARRFRDEYLKVRADLSHVNWIATCNDLDKLSRPIRSRFTSFKVRPPSHEEMPSIIRAIYADLLAEQGVAHAFSPELSDTVVNHLAAKCPAPRAVRNLLRRAIVAAAVRSHKQQPGQSLRDIRVQLHDLPDAALIHPDGPDGNGYLM
jgi:ATP-dependent Lon protease